MQADLMEVLYRLGRNGMDDIHDLVLAVTQAPHTHTAVLRDQLQLQHHDVGKSSHPVVKAFEDLMVKPVKVRVALGSHHALSRLKMRFCHWLHPNTT
jgi:hypothetical protein